MSALEIGLQEAGLLEGFQRDAAAAGKTLVEYLRGLLSSQDKSQSSRLTQGTFEGFPLPSLEEAKRVLSSTKDGTPWGLVSEEEHNRIMAEYYGGVYDNL